MFYTIYKWIRFIYYRYFWKNASLDRQKREAMGYCNLVSSYVSTSPWIIEMGEFKALVRNSLHNNKIIESAENIVKNRLPILSFSYYELGDEIQWDFDYEKRQHFSDLKDAKGKGCDIKKAWELSRMHQLLPLVKAYYLTDNDKFVDKIFQLTDDWYNKNKPFSGVNWTNPMEISIRCINIINVIKLLPQLCDNRPWLERINHNLIYSGVYIWHNLENKTLVNNNHYLSDLTGLIFLSIYFKDSEERSVKELAHKWLSHSIKELRKEFKCQILPDGGSFELSSSYHAYDLELVYYSYLLLLKNGMNENIHFKRVVEKMCTLLKGISINGSISLIGDNDNSHLFRLSDLYPYEDCNNYSDLLNACQLYMHNYEIPFKSYPYFGLYRLHKENLDAFVKCGALTKATGHSHNDQLGYVLWYKGRQIIADPGTFCYTSDLKTRNMFRGTSYHSVVQISDAEQNKLKNCFSVIDKCKSRCSEFSDVKFTGYHTGYLKSHNVKVKRNVEIDDKTFIVVDDIGDQLGVSRITFSPDVKADGEDRFSVNDISFHIEADAPLKIHKINFSPSYGIMTDTLQIEIYFSKSLTYKIVFE